MDKIVISPNPVASLGFMLARPSPDGLGHVGNIYRKADADLFAAAPAMLTALRAIAAYETERPAGAELDYVSAEQMAAIASAILARIDGTPPAQPAPPTKGIAETVAAGLWRAKAAKEITVRPTPKKLQPMFDGIKWAAFSIACELRGLDPEFDRAGFMAAAGYPGEF